MEWLITVDARLLNALNWMVASENNDALTTSAEMLIAVVGLDSWSRYRNQE